MHNPFRRQVAFSVPTVDVATAKKLMEQMGDPTVKNPLCVHCGCYHTQACPRVKRLKFKSADIVEEVEFWQDTCYSKDSLLTPEQIAEVSLQTEVEDDGTKA
jgi:hypothetical protein